MKSSRHMIDWDTGRIKVKKIEREQKVWKFLVAGDISLSTECDFGDVSSLIKSCDFSIFNLESVFIRDSCSSILKAGPKLRSDEKLFQNIASCGFSAACLANNHIMDYGEKGLKKTISLLEKKGILYLGAGKNCKSALAPLIIDTKEFKLGILNIAEAEESACGINSPGACDISKIDFQQEIRILSRKVDLCVLIYHGGKEYIPIPPPYVYRLFNDARDAGASIIIGHHPHVPQGISIVDDAIMAFSLGNLFVNNPKSINYTRSKKIPLTNYGYMIEFILYNAEIIEANIHPYYLDEEKKTIALLKGESKKEFLYELKLLSEVLKSPKKVDYHWMRVSRSAKFKMLPLEIASALTNAESEGNIIKLIKNALILNYMLLKRRREYRRDAQRVKHYITTPSQREFLLESLSQLISSKYKKKEEISVDRILEEWNLI